MSELIQQLDNALANVDKKVYDDGNFLELIANVFVCKGIKCKYFRKFYKNANPEKYDEEECEDIYDTIKEARENALIEKPKYDICDVENYIKRHPVKPEFTVLGEKDPVHEDTKYISMKKHYEDNEGWCKLQSPAGYGRIVINNGVKTFQIEDEITYFHNVNFYVQMKGEKHPRKFNFARVWVTDPDIKTYSKIVFDPLNTDTRALNLFSAYCQFKEGLKVVNIDRAFEHYKSLCGYDNACFEYLMNYFAHIVQKPYERVNTAVVMYGSEGIGKNIGIGFIGNIIGKQYWGESSCPDDLFGKFAKGMFNRIIFVYDEGQKGDTKSFMNRLKTAVTSDKLRVEFKGKDQYEVDNYCRLFFPTNDREPFPIVKGARRWFYLKGSDKYIDLGKEKSAKHFEDLSKWLKEENVQYSFYQFLKNRDISQWNANVVPQSEGLKQATEIPLVLRCFTETILRKDVKAYKPSELLEIVIEYCKKNNYSYGGYNPTNLGTHLQEYVEKGCVNKKRAASGFLYTFDKEKFSQYLKRYNFNLEIAGNEDSDDTLDKIDLEIELLEKKLAEKYKKKLEMIDALFKGDPLEHGIEKPIKKTLQKRIISTKPEKKSQSETKSTKSSSDFFSTIEKDFW